MTTPPNLTILPSARQSRAPDPRIVSTLEELLEQAKRGEITSLMVAADVEGEGYLRIANFQDRWHMLGALEWMKASLLGFEFHQDED